MVGSISSQKLKHIINSLKILLLDAKMEERLALHVGQEGHFELLFPPIIIIRVHFLENSFENIAFFVEHMHDGLSPRQDSVAKLLDVTFIDLIKLNFPVPELLDNFPVQESEGHIHHDPAQAVFRIIIRMEELGIHFMALTEAVHEIVRLIDSVLSEKALLDLIGLVAVVEPGVVVLLLGLLDVELRDEGEVFLPENAVRGELDQSLDSRPGHELVGVVVHPGEPVQDGQEFLLVVYLHELVRYREEQSLGLGFDYLELLGVVVEVEVFREVGRHQLLVYRVFLDVGRVVHHPSDHFPRIVASVPFVQENSIVLHNF